MSETFKESSIQLISSSASTERFIIPAKDIGYIFKQAETPIVPEIELSKKSDTGVTAKTSSMMGEEEEYESCCTFNVICTILIVIIVGFVTGLIIGYFIMKNNNYSTVDEEKKKNQANTMTQK